jgi:cytochrome c peroxidase
MNCRQCHLGDDFLPQQPLAARTYCDFSRRSPIPKRDDRLTSTVRNAPLMINLGLPREVPLLMHFDGEFAGAEDLVVETLTGRNFGWLPQEHALAVAHIAKVIRNDTGANPRHVLDARGRGIAYRVVMLGTDMGLPRNLLIPAQYRIDVVAASHDQVLQTVAKLMDAYMNSLRFGTKNTRRESGAPYDLFLEKNRLPAWPEAGEPSLDYAHRLLTLIEHGDHFEWVTPGDGTFKEHAQSYRFGAAELQGLKILFARPGGWRRAHVGNCVTCHTPPQFTDYRLHNNGASQKEYDDIFGRGAFAALDVPVLAARNENHDAYLPASFEHPQATSRFRSAPSADRPGYADLGVWNIYANPDFPKPQAALTTILCGQFGQASKRCTPEKILPLSIAYFKTPSIRDPGHSYPYFHSGAMVTIEDVLRYYVATTELARDGKIRNASAELSGIRIDAADVAPLAAFLRSLNEDYH